MKPTKAELAAGLAIVRSVAETVRDVGRAPRGVIYSALMGRGATYTAYETIEGILTRAGIVRIESDCLIWCAGETIPF